MNEFEINYTVNGISESLPAEGENILIAIGNFLEDNENVKVSDIDSIETNENNNV